MRPAPILTTRLTHQILLDECSTEVTSGEGILSLVQQKRQEILTKIAAGIISYMKTKAATLALDKATIPGADYLIVYIDTIKVMSMMIQNPLLVEKQETILRKCLVSKSIEDQVTELAATKALLPATNLYPWSDYLFAFLNEKALDDCSAIRKATQRGRRLLGSQKVPLYEVKYADGRLQNLLTKSSSHLLGGLGLSSESTFQSPVSVYWNISPSHGLKGMYWV
jgi:hypothetical protein